MSIYSCRELSDFRRFKISLNASLHLQPNSKKSLQLKALTAYQRGQFEYALSVLEKCLSIDDKDLVCLYFKGLVHTASGQLYTAVLSHTQVTAYSNTPQLQLSPEFIQAHYLREYSRYLHQKLDGSIMNFDLEAHLSPAFKVNWVHQSPYLIQDFEAMPGIQPNIKDVESVSWSSLPNATQVLLCAAKRIGNLTESNVDGHLARPRVNLAMGLAAVHVSQLLQKLWTEIEVPEFKNIHLEILQLIAKYLQIADPEMPVVYSDAIPARFFKLILVSNMPVFSGYSVSPRLNGYFEVVYKLIKSMLHHQTDSQYTALAKDMFSIRTAEDLLKLMKYSSLPTNGLSLSMQVPSTRDPKIRLEGGVITLAPDSDQKLQFHLHLPSHMDRSKEFANEITSSYQRINRDIRIFASRTKDPDADRVIDSILTMIYYVHNWGPLTRSTGVVAYTLAMGMVMSFGWEVTGRLPPGKLLELEALLAGKPESFILVTKLWMKIQKQGEKSNLADLPFVSEALPTIRNLIEVLNLPKIIC
ncbi:hypothetical protein CAPTEDRAFT_171600 [Capitella teleta]|uniref:Uncharacterized protein n=1 Tax=Capitella teleta TaxID=283909 RepID=R7UKE1_CAPTE|nr:hypothetical protein CAPTEDRAFT_171600 [Capitella teleta]|eukprot:ELU04273.1 hypothetical protein CAPTEDRAFT_171600 [Capitella teleta]